MILLFLAVIYGFSMYYGQAQNCVRSQRNFALFGPSCEYLCHCGTSQCNNETGACPYNGECDGGWMGSGCQYINVAYNKTVNSNHLGNTDTIVDGIRDSCPYEKQQNIKPAYVTVSFGREVKITRVNIVFSNSVNVPPFAISVYDGNQTVVCGSVDNTNGQKEYVLNCNGTLFGQYLNITSQSSAGFQICEIQVPAGRNLAYGKPTLQSSLEHVYYASNAVDGLTFDNSPWVTCAHTKPSINPWWLLDLQVSVMIQWFRIFNRWDDTADSSLNERLKNFRILLSQDNLTFTQYYQDQNNGSNDPPLIIEPGLNKLDVLASFVKIDLQGTDRILTLCEVQVFGDCVDGRYGDCNKTCDTCLGKKCDKLTGYCFECVPGYYGGKCDKSCNNCKNGDCDKLTGRCHSCEAGKQGDFCQTDCVDRFYGDNCSQACGRCLDGDSCDKFDGHCPKGCQNGWKGARCLQECEVYFYGNCSIPCGYCANGKPCNKVNGSCDEDRCANGWQTAKCDKPCTDNYYGNCSTRCGHCKESAVCDKVNGSCRPRACSDGWEGDKCDIECNSTHYGQNCEQPCGHCLNITCERFTGNCTEDGCGPGWQGSRCDIVLSSAMIQKPVDTGANAGVIAGAVVAAVGVVIITAVIIVVMLKIRRRRDTIKRNTTTMERSTNNINLSVLNAERPIEKTANTFLERPRTYYNIEESNKKQSEPINKTNSDDIVESDVRSYNHYEKLKHTTGAAESAYSTIDHSQSGRHKELTYGAKLDESNTYYNTDQSTLEAKKEPYEMSGSINQNESSVNSDNYYEKVPSRPRN